MEIPDLKNLNASNCTERSMFLHYFDFWMYIKDNYPVELKWTEKLYWYYHGLIEPPKCIICGKPVKFINLKEGYRDYCSVKCMGGSKEIKEKKKNTTLKHYGVENPMNSKKIKDKVKSNNLKKYGVENPFQLDSVKEQIKKTNREKYGVDYPQQSKEIYEKSKQTNKEKYGVEYNSQNETIKKKKVETSLKKYGTKSPFQSDEFKEKSRETCLRKYGVDNYNKTQEYREMMQEKMPEIREKMAETCMERYGVDVYNKSDDFKSQMPLIIEKSKETSIKKYGVDSYSKTQEYLQRCHDTKKLNHTFNSSAIEEAFATWLTENNIKFERQYRCPEYPFNCDFYFPSTKFFLEIQGSWTHGGHPYDPLSPDDQAELQKMIDKNSDFYNTAIETWTVRDPLKRKTAKENGLNWTEVFTNDINVLIENVKNKI